MTVEMANNETMTPVRLKNLKSTKLKTKKEAMPISAHMICFSKKEFGSTNEFIVMSPADTSKKTTENNIQSTPPEIFLMELFRKFMIKVAPLPSLRFAS